MRQSLVATVAIKQVQSEQRTHRVMEEDEGTYVRTFPPH